MQKSVFVLQIVQPFLCERLYSAKVPRSSLAEVHREFVHHILEHEVGQKEGQLDKKEKVRKERKMELAINDHNAHEAWM